MTVTGLMFYNARYYDPVARNFVSPDTIIPDPASSLGWNRYTYVNNNPINYNDPTGHELVVNGHASACGGSSIPGCEHQNAKREQRTTRAQNKADLFEHEGLEFHEAISAPSVTEVAFNNEVQYHLERFTKNQYDLQASPDMFCNSGLFDPLCGAETAADVIFNVIMQKPSQVLEEQGIRSGSQARVVADDAAGFSVSVTACAIVCVAWRTLPDGSIDFGWGTGFAVGAGASIGPDVTDPTSDTGHGSAFIFSGSCTKDSLKCDPGVGVSIEDVGLTGVYYIEWVSD